MIFVIVKRILIVLQQIVLINLANLVAFRHNILDHITILAFVLLIMSADQDIASITNANHIVLQL
jgi:hypothetical protein